MQYSKSNPHQMAAQLSGAIHNTWGGDEIRIYSSEVRDDGLSVYFEGDMIGDEILPISGSIRVDSFYVDFPEYDGGDLNMDFEDGDE